MLKNMRFVSQEEANLQIRKLINKTISPLTENYAQELEDSIFEALPKDSAIFPEIILDTYIEVSS